MIWYKILTSFDLPDLISLIYLLDQFDLIKLEVPKGILNKIPNR